MGTHGSGIRHDIPPTIQDIGLSGEETGLYSGVAVQNTWYTVLAAKSNVRIKQVSFRIATAGETIELEITDSAGVETKSQAANADTSYYLVVNGDQANSYRYTVSTTNPAGARSFLVEDKTFKVRVRKTTANGANTLSCKAVWARW